MENRFFSKNLELAVITIILAACSISYEILIANAISLMSGFHILWQTLTVGIYTLALGIGTWLSEKSKKSVFEKLIGVEAWLSLSASLFMLVCITSFSVFYILKAKYHLPIEKQFQFMLLPILISQTFTLAIGFLSGYELPLMIRAAEDPERKDGFASILGWNYLGTLIGTLAIVLVLFPLLDKIYAMALISLLNLAVCLYLVMRKIAVLKKTVIALMVLALGLNVIVIGKRDFIVQSYLKSLYFARGLAPRTDSVSDFFEQSKKLKRIKRVRSPYQYIDIVDYTDFRRGKIVMALNEEYQVGTLDEQIYHEGFVHLPVMVFDKMPKNVLLLGAGDGLAVRELIKYKNLERITQIELDPEMLKMARSDRWLSTLNKKSVRDPRVHIIQGDAFHWVRTQRNETFDAVFIDFPYPYNFSVLRIYSLEFYRNVKNLVKPDGFVVVDCPLSLAANLRGEDDPYYKFNSMLFTTFDASGFKTIVPYQAGPHNFMLLAVTKRELRGWVPSNFPFRLRYINDRLLMDIAGQRFPHQIDPQFLNSIFKPYVIYTPKFPY